MKERILRLCKRLNKFSLDEITAIAEDIDGTVLELQLTNFEQEKKLIKQGETYCYNKKISTSNRTSKLSMMFQYHSRERIDIIIKAFCCECSTEHLSKILNLGVSCVNDFYRFFRETLYTKQKKELEL